MKSFLPLGLLIFSSAFALEESPDFYMRRAWVKEVKLLQKYLEKTRPYELTMKTRSWHLIEEAWADSRYNCFYGGWPSVKSGNTCQNPALTNSAFDKSSCGENKFLCQPLLFGPKLCVPSATQSERDQIYSNCEKMFQEKQQGSYEFLKNPSSEALMELQELSLLAVDVCQKDNSPECQAIMKKFPQAMRAIQQGLSKSVTASPVPSKIGTVKEQNCDVNPDRSLNELSDILKQVGQNNQGPYEKIKAEFLKSPFCDPQLVINDPKDRPSAPLMQALVQDLKSFDPFEIKEKRPAFVERLKNKYSLSEAVVNEVNQLLASIRTSTDAYEERRGIIARMRGLITQDFLANYRPGDRRYDELIKDQLVKNNIFKINDAGEAECPFIDRDAFEKALEGRKEVLKRFGGSLPNKNQITIVDYTKPSNQRRMFVIDLATGKVLHNTWVAHGAGGNSVRGTDGLGSFPKMSNTSGSAMSSDGFIIATAKSAGSKFGNNVLIKGIDDNNSNLAARSVVVHGWGSPMNEYSSGVQDYDFDGNTLPAFDPVERVKRADFRNLSTQQMEKAFSGLSGSVSNMPFLNGTEGCLGVPITNMKHLDRKGRNKTQIELLRDDLPGSLIFSYSGPEMKSRYLK